MPLRSVFGPRYFALSDPRSHCQCKVRKLSNPHDVRGRAPNVMLWVFQFVASAPTVEDAMLVRIVGDILTVCLGALIVWGWVSYITSAIARRTGRGHAIPYPDDLLLGYVERSLEGRGRRAPRRQLSGGRVRYPGTSGSSIHAQRRDEKFVRWRQQDVQPGCSRKHMNPRTRLPN